MPDFLNFNSKNQASKFYGYCGNFILIEIRLPVYFVNSPIKGQILSIKNFNDQKFIFE